MKSQAGDFTSPSRQRASCLYRGNSVSNLLQRGDGRLTEIKHVKHSGESFCCLHGLQTPLCDAFFRAQGCLPKSSFSLFGAKPVTVMETFKNVGEDFRKVEITRNASD